MRFSIPLGLLAVLALFAAVGCSSNKNENQPEPSVQRTLDSAANRVARDTMPDSSAQRDTSTNR
jgi:hypothetical protein